MIFTISTFQQKWKISFSVCDLSPWQDQWAVPGLSGEETKYIQTGCREDAKKIYHMSCACHCCYRRHRSTLRDITEDGLDRCRTRAQKLSTKIFDNCFKTIHKIFPFSPYSVNGYSVTYFPETFESINMRIHVHISFLFNLSMIFQGNCSITELV